MTFHDDLNSMIFHDCGNPEEFSMVLQQILPPKQDCIGTPKQDFIWKVLPLQVFDKIHPLYAFDQLRYMKFKTTLFLVCTFFCVFLVTHVYTMKLECMAILHWYYVYISYLN